MPRIDYEKLNERAANKVDDLDATEYNEWLEEWLMFDEAAYANWREWAVNKAYKELLDDEIENAADRDEP